MKIRRGWLSIRIFVVILFVLTNLEKLVDNKKWGDIIKLIIKRLLN